MDPILEPLGLVAVSMPVLSETQESHLEVEMKIRVGKKESKMIARWLQANGFRYEKQVLIVDFIEPSRSVTSRVRLEKALDSGSWPVKCYIGRKSHPFGGDLKDFVRKEQDPSVTPEIAVNLLMEAIVAQNGEPIPYYSKKRRSYSGCLAGHQVSIAIDTPKGLLKKYRKRFLEVEIQIPLTAEEKEVATVVDAIRKFIFELVGEERTPEISYRRMVLNSWTKRGML